MCMEDIRIGRKIRTVWEYVPTAVGAYNLAAKVANNRVTLVFGNPNANAACLTFKDEGAVIRGLSIQGFDTMELNIRDHGDLVTREFWVTTPGGGAGRITVVQGLLEDQ